MTKASVKLINKGRDDFLGRLQEVEYGGHTAKRSYGTHLFFRRLDALRASRVKEASMIYRRLAYGLLLLPNQKLFSCFLC